MVKVIWNRTNETDNRISHLIIFAKVIFVSSHWMRPYIWFPNSIPFHSTQLVITFYSPKEKKIIDHLMFRNENSTELSQKISYLTVQRRCYVLLERWPMTLSDCSQGSRCNLQSTFAPFTKYGSSDVWHKTFKVAFLITFASENNLLKSCSLVQVSMCHVRDLNDFTNDFAVFFSRNHKFIHKIPRNNSPSAVKMIRLSAFWTMIWNNLFLTKTCC